MINALEFDCERECECECAYDKARTLLHLYVNRQRHDAMDWHRMRVFGLAYFPSTARAHLMASGLWHNTLQFWDDRCEHAIENGADCVQYL